jgi:osmotically inducible protein OsmC
MIRKSTASWKGSGRNGKGTLSTQSGVLSKTPFGYSTRFADGPGTNPEELLAAAHAGCFTMAVAFGLQLAGFAADTLETEAEVALEPDGEHYMVAHSILTLRAQVPGITNSRFQEIAHEAERNCPISRALRTKVGLAAVLEPQPQSASATA